MQEVEASFQGRPVLSKQKGFALFHPVAYVLSQIISEIPILLVQVSVFSLILYFMTGLQMDVGAFFTCWALVFATTMCVTAL
jgi:ABC-type multidrug transport system permease subunit